MSTNQSLEPLLHAASVDYASPSLYNLPSSSSSNTAGNIAVPSLQQQQQQQQQHRANPPFLSHQYTPLPHGSLPSLPTTSVPLEVAAQTQQQQQDVPTGAVASTSNNGDADDGEPKKKPLKESKRAAQNRAAQRAFRERRDQYIRTLEHKAEMYDKIVASSASHAPSLPTGADLASMTNAFPVANNIDMVVESSRSTPQQNGATGDSSAGTIERQLHDAVLARPQVDREAFTRLLGEVSEMRRKLERLEGAAGSGSGGA